MAKIPQFKKISVSDKELQAVQDNVEKALVPIISSAILTNNIVEDVDFTAGTDTYVEHKLSGTARRFFVVRINADTTVYESSTANAAPGKFIILRAGATCRASILFF